MKKKSKNARTRGAPHLRWSCGAGWSTMELLEKAHFAAFLPLAAQSMYTNLGFHWASTLLAFLALLLGLAPIIFVWKGRWFREKSPFMQSGGEIMKT